MSEERRGKSPWFYLGIGCVVFLIIGVIGMGTCGYGIWRYTEKVKKELTDPAARERKVLEVLGTSSMPEGYFAGVGLDVPMAMQVAILTDQPVSVTDKDVDPRFKERGFLYTHIPLKKADDPKLLDFFEARTDDPQVLSDAGVNMDFGRGKILARGVIEGPPRLLYAVQRGRAPMALASNQLLSTLILIQCQQDSSLRVAIWTGPDPSAGGELGAPVAAGSVADPAAIGTFLGQFNLCR
ncbi:MAG: hypothetical protein U0V87_07680 [Acidobacteriota bacterium]